MFTKLGLCLGKRNPRMKLALRLVLLFAHFFIIIITDPMKRRTKNAQKIPDNFLVTVYLSG
jgi:hypothetical protein